jgi:signal transduction histidine kinase
VWNEQGAALAFVITPAYYQTNAFRVLSVVLLVGLVWAAWQLRLRQVARALEIALGARAAERTRIARDLHDTLLQDFQGLLLLFESALKLLPERPADARARLQRALDQAMDATTQARNAVQGLRSPAIGADDLVRSLANIADEATGAEHPAVHVVTSGTPRRLKPLVHNEVFRIAGEALRNALRHAETPQVTVEIRYDSHQFRVRVRDEGKGIDQEAIRSEAREGHFGLHGMRERAEIIGGRLDVWSKAGEGTRVDLSIPGAAAYIAFSGRSSIARLLAWAHIRHDRMDV